MVDNLDISDNDEPEFDDDRNISLEKARNFIEEFGYLASPDAMNVLDEKRKVINNEIYERFSW